MKRERDFPNTFDENFEITYEYGWEYVDPYNDSAPKYGSGYDHDDNYKYDSDYRYSHPARRRSRKGVPLAAPIQKGGRVLSRAAAALVRSLTAVLILATAAYVAYTFWRASAPYGDIMESIQSGTISMTLAAYLCIAAIFLLFEFIALLWSMTRVRMRDESGSWNVDAGRGLLSFVHVFASSYLSFLLYRFLPESPEILYGLRGALEVYGSMHNVLFGLCAAGVISCLVRKYFSH